MDKQDVRSCAKMVLVGLGILIFSTTVNCETRAVNESSCKRNNNACDPTGTCVESAGVCKCDEGYTGNRCQHLIVNCTDGANCTKNQVCISTTPGGDSDVKCVCSPIHYGDNCTLARLCLSNPCAHGTCQEDYMNNLHRYKCICPYGYEGQNCDFKCSLNCHNGTCERKDKNKMTCECNVGYSQPKCKHKKDPRSDKLEMRPIKGPIAGGTLLKFDASQHDPSLIESVQKITIDGVGSFTIQNMSEGVILAKTPSYPNGSDTEIEVIVEVELKGTDTVITRTFTYKLNPTISNIYPRSLIQSARTSVTVTGTNLDTVGDPRLIITAVKRKMKNETRQFISKRCTASKSGTSLICKAPKIPPKKNIIFDNEDIQKRSFELEDTKVNILKRAVSRLRRQEPDGEQDDIDFIFSLQLDGVKDYTDLTENLPNLAYVDVNPDPTFEDGQIFYVEDGGESQIIGIKGENVDSGVVEDFAVLIGNASCSNIGLTNDKLYCYPPTSLLELGDNVRSNNEADVTVKVGETLSYNVGYVVYEKEETVSLMKVFVPVVAAIGGALLIVIIILIICACRKRRTKTEQKQRILPPPSATDIHNMTPGGNDNYYTGTDQSAAPNPYYMVVNDDRKQ